MGNNRKEETREGIQGFLQDRIDDVKSGLGKMDDAYSKAIRENVGGVPDNDVEQLSKMGLGGQTRGIVGQLLGVKRNQTMFDTSADNYNEFLDKSVRNTLVASRYVIPAAGVTAAGAGLMKLAEVFGGEADRPAPTEIVPQ